MRKIVATPGQAIVNIRNFEDELARSAALQERLAYARAWYAHQDEGGTWRFAPSKFVGYQDSDAEAYLEAAEEMDGRRTEAQLQMWFDVVDPNTSLHQELYSALSSLLAKYGKAPSTKARISVQRARRKLQTEAGGDANTTVVNLIVAVAKTLPTEHFQRLRDELEDIWA